jgi:predicted flap endonuclease-1-like 5' DNA nuclease
MADLATVATRRTCATLRGAFSRLDAASVSISLPSGGHAVAWFVGQSAVMIVLAFLLGLLVGWLVWYRRSEQVFDVAAGRARPGTKTDMTIELPPVGPGASDETTELPPVEDAPDLMDSLGATDEPVTSKKADSKKAGAKKASATEPAATPAVAAEIPHPRTAEAPIDNTPTDEITTAAAAQLASAVSPAAATNPKPSRAKAKRSRAAKPAAEPVAVVPTPMVDEPELAPIDDLARIEGIGPKIAGALVDGGIRSFDQLAEADVDALREAVNAAGITFAPSITTWSQQAKLLADGNEEEFQALTDRLVAGRAATDPADQPGPANDLARIEGIGPKVAAALVDAGIRTYRQLADADQHAVRAAINAAGITFAPSMATWSQQAQLLADGDEDGFTDLTLRLVAGRDNIGADTPSDDAPTLPIASTNTAPAGAAAGATASAPAGAAAGGVASAVAGDKEHV